MSGIDQILRFGVLGNGRLNGAGPISSGNTGSDAFGGLDGHGKVGTKGCAVARGHQRQLQLAATFFSQRQAYQAAGVGHHEIDGFGRDKVCRHHQIAFIFAIFFVNQNDNTPRLELFDDFRDGRNGAVGHQRNRGGRSHNRA